MADCDLSALHSLIGDMEKIIEDIPERRTTLHRELADDLKKALDRNILSSGLKDEHGRVRSWQSPHVGSGGGYVAVRPQDGGVSDRAGRRTKSSKVQVTIALERGHRHRLPGKTKSRIKTPRARAYGYYKTTQGQTEEIGRKRAEKWMDEIVRKLEEE